MKKFNLLFGASLLLTLGLASCSNTNANTEPDLSYNNRLVEEVTFDIDYYSLTIGESLHITPTIKFKNNKEVEVSKAWKSSKTTVATVDEGLVYGVGSGTTYITFRAGFKMASCTIVIPGSDTPTPTPEPGPGPTPEPGEFTITLSSTSLTLSPGGNASLTASTSEAADVSWSSSNENVAKYENGKVVAVGLGNCTITASANNKSASCSVTVKEASEDDPDRNVTVYFFLDYNNVDMYDESGTKLLAKFKWYQDRPLTDAPLPEDPSAAADPAFPYFVGWSSHTIIDTKDDLWDLENDVIGTRTFIFIYGIWSDVEDFVL